MDGIICDAGAAGGRPRPERSLGGGSGAGDGGGGGGGEGGGGDGGGGGGGGGRGGAGAMCGELGGGSGAAASMSTSADGCDAMTTATMATVTTSTVTSVLRHQCMRVCKRARLCSRSICAASAASSMSRSQRRRCRFCFMRTREIRGMVLPPPRLLSAKVALHQSRSAPPSALSCAIRARPSSTVRSTRDSIFFLKVSVHALYLMHVHVQLIQTKFGLDWFGLLSMGGRSSPP